MAPVSRLVAQGKNILAAQNTQVRPFDVFLSRGNLFHGHVENQAREYRGSHQAVVQGGPSTYNNVYMRIINQEAAVVGYM
ncbi:hypothetical protein RSOLAG22IIIB_12164 [Rhizoctonia solani]|uniref:Uncharacterized protein n=1 Tax=Rhizoctonia solani TaxID=456999 RepID=A0A0K6GCB6_9AGAM|nr:hypothetical protein RSOLAG22IIIB_12164 [Rhizoctonia solani]